MFGNWGLSLKSLLHCALEYADHSSYVNFLLTESNFNQYAEFNNRKKQNENVM